MCLAATSSDSDKKLMKMWIDGIMLFKKTNKLITYIIEAVFLQKGDPKEKPIKNQVQTVRHT